MAKSKEGKSVKIRILQAGKNKPMPRAHGLELEGLCRGNGVEVQRKEVVGLHTDVIPRLRGGTLLSVFRRRSAGPDIRCLLEYLDLV